MMRLDNGARDGQSHAHSLRFAGEKRFEDLFQYVFWNARAAIRHGYFGKIFDARSPNVDNAIFFRRALHRVDGIHDKVQNDLLKLNAVAEDRKRILGDKS